MVGSGLVWFNMDYFHLKILTMEEQILKAYKKHCKKTGIIFQEPSDITLTRKFAYLYNSYGILAKYDLKECIFV